MFSLLFYIRKMLPCTQKHTIKNFWNFWWKKRIWNDVLLLFLLLYTAYKQTKAQPKTTLLFVSGSGIFMPADNRAHVLELQNDRFSCLYMVMFCYTCRCKHRNPSTQLDIVQITRMYSTIGTKSVHYLITGVIDFCIVHSPEVWYKWYSIMTPHFSWKNWT